MSSTDARCLSPDAQETLRLRVIEAVRNGMKPAVAARTFGVSRSSVWNWRKRVELGNIRSLKSRPRGRPRRSRLPGHQAATVVRTITDRCPDQLKLPFALWTRAAVKRWLERHPDRLRLFFLPGYSPDLNPDKYLNQDVKTNALGRQRPPDQPTMMRNVRSYLWSTQRQPEIVQSYFHHESVTYAAM